MWVSNTIDAALLKRCVSGRQQKSLEAKKEWINELNVFPVPDGDTGTNMTLTIMAAAKEVAALENPTMESPCQGHLVRLPAGSQGKFRRHPFPAFPWIHKGD